MKISSTIGVFDNLTISISHGEMKFVDWIKMNSITVLQRSQVTFWWLLIGLAN